MSDRLRAASSAGDPLAPFPVPRLLMRQPWLALTDTGGSLDFERLFGSTMVRVERTSQGFAAALLTAQPEFVVLVAPPARGADVELVGAWIARGLRAALVSPRAAVAIRLRALELGFEDAIDSAADPMEVVGRLSIAGRPGRAERSAMTEPTGPIALGRQIELDRAARVVRKDGQVLPLRPREYQLLEFLATHPNRVFSREEILRHVWKGRMSSPRAVDVHVHWLRIRIEADPAHPVRLVTVHSTGYRLDLGSDRPDER